MIWVFSVSLDTIYFSFLCALSLSWNRSERKVLVFLKMIEKLFSFSLSIVLTLDFLFYWGIFLKYLFSSDFSPIWRDVKFIQILFFFFWLFKIVIDFTLNSVWFSSFIDLYMLNILASLGCTLPNLVQSFPCDVGFDLLVLYGRFFISMLIKNIGLKFFVVIMYFCGLGVRIILV